MPGQLPAPRRGPQLRAARVRTFSWLYGAPVDLPRPPKSRGIQVPVTGAGAAGRCRWRSARSRHPTGAPDRARAPGPPPRAAMVLVHDGHAASCNARFGSAALAPYAWAELWRRSGPAGGQHQGLVEPCDRPTAARRHGLASVPAGQRCGASPPLRSGHAPGRDPRVAGQLRATSGREVGEEKPRRSWAISPPRSADVGDWEPVRLSALNNDAFSGWHERHAPTGAQRLANSDSHGRALWCEPALPSASGLPTPRPPAGGEATPPLPAGRLPTFRGSSLTPQRQETY